VAQKTTVAVGGRTLHVTNLDKVLYPDSGTTKADVLGYYAEIAPYLIDHAEWRPATRKRFVHGVGTAASPGPSFFQKNLEPGAPEWIVRYAIEHSDRTNVYPLVNDVATLVWLAQLSALEIHVPQWRFDERGERLNPDRIVLDLDPGDGVDLDGCAQVALWVRSALDELGLSAVPVTSGSKGIHLYAELPGEVTSDTASDLAHQLARLVEAEHPDQVVSGMAKALRPGKVFIDWSQNNGAKTTVAPYSLRGRYLPTVAAPRMWGELERPGLRQLTASEVLVRVKDAGDPLAAAGIS